MRTLLLVKQSVEGFDTAINAQRPHWPQVWVNFFQFLQVFVCEGQLKETLQNRIVAGTPHWDMCFVHVKLHTSLIYSILMNFQNTNYKFVLFFSMCSAEKGKICLHFENKCVKTIRKKMENQTNTVELLLWSPWGLISLWPKYQGQRNSFIWPFELST